MALQSKSNFVGHLKLHTPTGVVNLRDDTIELDCYVKVNMVKANKDKATAEVVFTSGNSVFTKFYEFATDMQGENPIRQAYKHLKTLPEFAGATDC
jgi:hypothetical protein